jgi:hypothetical protein
MLVMYEHFQVLVQARVLDGLFLLVTVATLAGALLALALPTGPLPDGESAETPERAARAGTPETPSPVTAEAGDGIRPAPALQLDRARA